MFQNIALKKQNIYQQSNNLAHNSLFLFSPLSLVLPNYCQNKKNNLICFNRIQIRKIGAKLMSLNKNLPIFLKIQNLILKNVFCKKEAQPRGLHRKNIMPNFCLRNLWMGTFGRTLSRTVFNNSTHPARTPVQHKSP